jgi:hypothetical protein
LANTHRLVLCVAAAGQVYQHLVGRLFPFSAKTDPHNHARIDLFDAAGIVALTFY